MPHTPTPWATFRGWPDEIIPACDADKKNGCSVYDEQDKERYAQHIARCVTDRHGRGDGKANAAHIVRCVNAHDALVAALAEMLAAHSNENIGVRASLRRIKAKEQARAAIQAAQP
jgi:hypothetical protein